MITTLRFFLMDGDPNGRLKCSFSSGWNGIGYKMTSADLARCDDIEALRSAGVYFLFGYDEAENDVVYIGQGNIRQNGQGVLARIKEPHNQIPDWKTCVIFVANGDFSLGPTELNFLENKFTVLSQQAGRYIVKNGNTPNPAKLSEEDLADMNTFVQNASFILNTLGYRVLEPARRREPVNARDEYSYTFRNNLKATGIETNDGFVLLKGSQIVPDDQIADGCREKCIREREKHSLKIQDSVLIDDILFKSSSAAASFCSGQSRSGPQSWIGANGRTLRENKETIA